MKSRYYVSLLCLVLLCPTLAPAGGLRPWRPTLEMSIDKTSLRLGETATVTYRAGDGATACRANVTHWAMFVGKSDGILLPTEGQYTITPEVEGEYVTNLTAYKRTFDLNGSGGPDGRRRTMTLWIEIQVTK